MKNLSTFAFTLLAGLALASSSADPITVKLAPKEGSLKYKYRLETSVQGQNVTVTSNLDWKTKKVGAEKADVEVDWADLKIDLGGSELNAEVSQQKISYLLATGEPTAISGGIQGTDEQRSVLIAHFLAPKEAISEGGTYTYEVKANDKATLPAFKYVGKYEGKVDLKGKSVYKFTAKFAEVGTDVVESTTTYFVREDGTVVKAEGTYKNLPLPQVGTNIEGKVLLELVD